MTERKGEQLLASLLRLRDELLDLAAEAGMQFDIADLHENLATLAYGFEATATEMWQELTFGHKPTTA